MSTPGGTAPPCADPRLGEALDYVLASPGKQLRRRLLLASADLFGGSAVSPVAETVATAVEWLHTYSLVHDDLPAMDDDDLRRGRPTVHKEYDDATAILVGDGLQASAFALVAAEQRLNHQQRVDLIALLADAVGFQGMVGGQALDIAAEGETVSQQALEEIHRLKTGALFRAAVVAGAICGDAGESDRDRLDRFAGGIGLAFQVVDDVLDATRTSEQLGKTAGKDAAAKKSTYVSYLGIEGARATAQKMLDDALAELAPYGQSAEPLRELANLMVSRSA